MSSVNQIIEKYLDNADQVSEEELQTLVDALKENPKLASELQSQLVVNELLAQRYGVDRQDFMAQVDQRIRDFKMGEAEISEQVSEIRALAEHGLEQWNADSHRARKRGIFISLAIAVMVAVAAGTWFVVSPSLMYIAEITVSGGGSLLSPSGEEKQIIEGVPTKIKKGDIIKTSPSEVVTFRYEDETQVQIGTNSALEFLVGSNRGKKVKIRRGTASANVSPQGNRGHMTFETNDAEAQVLGTELFLMVAANHTRLDVTEGSVELIRRKDNSSITVPAGHFATTKAMVNEKRSWPSNRTGLVFLLQTDFDPNFVFDPETQMNRRCVVGPVVEPKWNSDGAMLLGHGRFEAIGSDRDLWAACKKSNELTIEAVIDPFECDHGKMGRIMAFSNGEPGRNFALSHEGKELFFQISTSKAEAGPAQRRIRLCELPDHKAHHLLVSLKPGRLTCYLDGRLQHSSDDNKGDLSNWARQHLVFGDDHNGGHEWGGLLEGIAIYSRFVEIQEAEKNASAYRAMLETRSKIRTGK